MGSPRSITLLHLSDLQFGHNHRFGNLAAGDPDAEFDSLLRRLEDDLQRLRDGEGLKPDFVVVSGDLAEWGMRKEFKDAFEFLECLVEGLELPRQRVAVVPGNHDLNRKLCEAYFSECEANEQEPVPPFARKWEHYLRKFKEFYAEEGDVGFTIEEPWTLWEVEELQLVVAGLNSTMRESHLPDDRYGWVGERQLHWFSERLEAYARKGWFRLGVVHHNTSRGAVVDDENLRDVDDLENVLAPHLNLLLHGHTHDGKLSWLGRWPLPVLSTGSAALEADARPAEVPNQYQLIRLHAGGIDRWVRRYDPGAKRWVADTTISADGGSGKDRHKISFADTGKAFDTDEDSFHEPPAATESTRIEVSNEFATRVMEVCELRHGNAKVVIEPMLGDLRYPYLRARVGDGGIAQIFPLGLVEGDVDRERVEGFCRKVFDGYRALDPHLRCTIVYGGDRPAPPVVKKAAELNVQLNSFVEYQGIIDFRGYLERQRGRLESDPVYPAALYVPQHLVYEVGERERKKVDDAVDQLMEWVAEPRARFVLVLGDFGTGKTFMLRELARRMPTEVPHLVPMLVELRSLEKARTVKQLVAQHLATANERFIDLKAFPYMLEKGRIALLVDGFDELAMRVTYKRATEHFDALLQAAGGDAKVILTSRTQHFESDQQVRSALLERAELLPGLSLCWVQPFDDDQILKFLEQRFGDREKALARFDLLDEIKDLLGLSQNPRMLDFIAQIPEKELREARARGGTITPAQLYRLLIDQWLQYEWDKAQVRGTALPLSAEQRWDAITELALCLWGKIDGAVHVSELTERVSAAAASLSTEPEDPVPSDPDTMAHLVGSRTLLARDDEGAFHFVHGSVMEWFVANQAADRVIAGTTPEALGQREMTDLMTAFFCDLAGRQAALDWARAAVGAQESSTVQSNAIRVLDRLGVGSAGAELAGGLLGGRSLVGRELENATLEKVDLTEALMDGANLRGANLKEAILARADLSRATLAGASLQGADMRGARLLGADLEGADLKGASLRRAKLIGAKGLPNDLAKVADVFGAALPGSVLSPALEAMEGTVTATAFHPFDDVLATGHEAGTVCLWDPRSGSQIRNFEAHGSSVSAIAFSSHGNLLLTAGGDATVRIWDPVTGKEKGTIVSGSPLRGLALSPDGALLAGAGSDGVVRIWEMSSREERWALDAHRGWARGVAFAPGGRVLASGGSDDAVRLWDPWSGAALGSLAGHRSGTWHMSFAPHGDVLATGGSDHEVRLWDWRNRRALSTLVGHRERVRQVCFSPDGRLLASSSDDLRVHLWDTETGALLHVIEGHAGEQPTLAFSPDGETLVDATREGTLRLTEPAGGTPIRQMGGRRRPVGAELRFSPDGQLIANIDEHGNVCLWDAGGGMVIRRISGHRGRIKSIAFSQNGQILATGGEDGAINLWNPQSGSNEETLYGLQGPIHSLAFVGSSRLIASAGGKLRMWNVDRGTEVAAQFEVSDQVKKLITSPEGRFLATLDHHSKVYLVDLTDQRVTLLSNQMWVSDLAFSADGRELAATGKDGTTYLWGTQSLDKRQVGGRRSAASSVAFSPTGDTLVTGTFDGNIRIWDGGAGKKLKLLDQEGVGVRSLACSPAEEVLASLGDDGAIRIWSLKNGALKMTLASVGEGWVAYAPNGRYKLDGRVGGAFWFVAGQCRFSPAEVDELSVSDRPRRIDADEPF